MTLRIFGHFIRVFSGRFFSSFRQSVRLFGNSKTLSYLHPKGEGVGLNSTIHAAIDFFFNWPYGSRFELPNNSLNTGGVGNVIIDAERLWKNKFYTSRFVGISVSPGPVGLSPAYTRRVCDRSIRRIVSKISFGVFRADADTRRNRL